MLFFVGQVLPYITAAVFIGGVVCRIACWLQVPVPFQLTQFPSPANGASRAVEICREVLFFQSLRHNDQLLWWWVWLFHLALAMIIIGHIAGISTLMHQFTMFGFSAAQSETISAVLGSAAGLLFIISLLVLFYRRTADSKVKRLSDPADYFDLLLLLAIAVTGNHMRLPIMHPDLAAIRDYLYSLIIFRPVPIPENWIFISHFLLVEILLIYFPFSKLMHFAGAIVNRLMLTEHAPVYPTPAGTPVRSPFAAKQVTAFPSQQATVSKGCE